MLGEQQRDIEAINYAKSSAEGERLRRLSIENTYKAAEIGERRMNAKIADELAETERERRMSEGNISDKESLASKISAQQLVVQAAENERLRRMNLLEGVLIQKQRQIDLEMVKLSQEIERLRRINEDGKDADKNDELFVAVNEEIIRRASLKIAANKSFMEQTRRIFGDIAIEAAEKAERKLTLQYVKDEEEKERARRVGEQVFTDCSSKAIREINRRLSIEMEETERTRRIGEIVVAQAVSTAESKRALILADVAVRTERIEQVDDEEKSANPRESLLFRTVIDELSKDLELKERKLNQDLAVELMDMEKFRRVTVEEAHMAQAAYARKQSRLDAKHAVEKERQYRIGLDLGVKAAERAASLLSRKLTSQLENEERARRMAHYPSKISA